MRPFSAAQSSGANDHCFVVAVQERFYEMPDPKFLYGSHYSSPAHVLFFLARAGISNFFSSHMYRFRYVEM